MKVLRPGIEGKVSADLALMARLVPRLAARVADVDPEPLVSEIVKGFFLTAVRGD